MKGKKILIIHFRVGKTDGVSLEIAAWKEILESCGAKVYLCGGQLSFGADFVIKHLEHQHDKLVFSVNQNAFNGFTTLTPEAFTDAFSLLSARLTKSFAEVFEKVRPDAVIISNIFSVGANLPAANALAAVLDRYSVPTLLVNHDFYWEKIRKKNPSNRFISNYLKNYFPPERTYMKYAVINKIARNKFIKQKRIVPAILYDTLNFKKEIPKDEYYKKLLTEKGVKENDIVALQATRVVRRKNIEISIDFIAEMEKQVKKTGPFNLHDGRVFYPDKNRVLLVEAGYAEKTDEDYLARLISYAESKNVKFITLNGKFRNKEEGLMPILKLHTYSDFVTYPSEYEGFGNQFLEAIFSKKPIALFEYPVFKSDIKSKGFTYISLGDKVFHSGADNFAKIPEGKLMKAAGQMLYVLKNKRIYEEHTSENFKLGRKYFSYNKTLNVLTKLLNLQTLVRQQKTTQSFPLIS